jgi:5-hydroxyisourate hydrolase-like protein (transthyretin family)
MAITRLQIRVCTSLLVLIGLILGASQHAFAQAHTRWYFAEGATGPTFELDLILANPTATPAQLRITFLRGDLAPHIVQQELPGTMRRTIRVNAIPGLEAEGNISILVESLNSVPIVAERTMYWIGTAKRGGHNTTGVETPRTTWYLAEGAANSFFSTYILLANPNTTAASVTVRFLKDDGGVVDQTYTVQGNRRYTIGVNNDVPGMLNSSFGAQITSTQPILVERAMYWLGFEGGSDAVAVGAPATTWMFAEGHTGSDFQTFFLLSNPNPSPTAANVTFYLETGAPVTKAVTVPANGRYTVPVNSYPEMLNLSFATTVTSTLPIVAERAIYWAGFNEGNATPGLTQGATKWAFSEGRVGTHEGQHFDTFFLLLNNSSSPLSVHGTFYLEDGTGSTHDFVIQPNSRYTLYAGTPPRMAGQAMSAFFEANAPFIAERATYWGAGWFGGHGSTGVPWTGSIATPPTQPRAATPTFSTPGGTYGQELTTSLSTATAGAIIRYTTDGSEPTAISQQYFGGNLSINATMTIKAKAFGTGYGESFTATAAYTLKPPPPVLQHPAGSYPAPFQFGISTNVPGALIRYTTDGSAPNEFSAVYSAPIQANFTQTLTLSARVFKQGWTPSDIVSAVYQVTQGLLPTPIPSPAAGVYFEGQTVTMSVPFGLIRYTTDGSDPTESSPIYSGQITVTTPLTLKARTFNPGYTTSNMLTARYDLKVRTPTVSPATGIINSGGVHATATSQTQSVTFRYTLDETEPTASSPEMSGGVFVQAGQTIVVRGFKSGWVTSDEGFATYEPEFPPVSAGTFSISGVQLSGFNSTSSTISFDLNGAAIDPSSVIVWRNGVEAPNGSSFVVQQSAPMAGGVVTAAVTVPNLVDGRNELEIFATDTGGLGVGTVATVWGGNRTASIRVMSASGSPVSGAQVQLTLLADQRMVETRTTNSNGFITVPSLPTSYPFRVQASAENYRPGSATLSAGTTSLILTLPRDNLTFNDGSDGWTGVVNEMDHSEGSPPLVPCPGCPIREDNLAAGAAGASTAGGPARPAAFATLSTDTDIQIHTDSTPGRSGSYRFVSAAGARTVRARYRVQTGEPQPWPDVFSISLRSITTGRQVVDQRTISQLYGAGALDVNQATGWMTITLTLDNDREEVELSIAVANHADNVNDTALWVDSIQEGVYEVTDFTLNDYKNSTHTHPKAQNPLVLDFLSASPHSYYGGKTRVNGTISIKAPQGATVTQVRLEVYYQEDRIAQAEVVSALRPALYQTVGVSETLAVTNSQLMFEIDSSQFSAFTLLTESNLVTQVVVTFSNGRTAVRPLGRDLIAFKYYTSTNRYPPRDPDNCVGLSQPFPCGGDDWARPRAVAFIAGLGSGFTWGDFSNMNGGPFPRHGSHQLGLDIDGHFSGFNRRDAAVAQQIIGQLNQHGRKIEKVWVAYTATATNAFYNAIRNVTLNDGRAATSVIRPEASHTTHFHWRLNISHLP